MTRFRRLALTALLLADAATAQAEAEDPCAEQAALVAAMVEARQSGLDRAGAETRLRAGLGDPLEKYAAVLPAMLDWVYSLPQDALGTGIGEAWRDQCAAQ